MMDKLRPVPAKLVAKGALAPAQIVRGNGTYDPVTDKKTKAPVIVACHAVVFDVERTNDSGASVTRTEIMCDQPIKVQDKITIGDRSYTVQRVHETAPHGEPILWKGVVG